MKPKSRNLLSELCATNTKASLVALWTDLSGLTKEQFIAEVDKLLTSKSGKTPKPKSPSSARAKLPRDNRPATKISYELERAGLRDLGQIRSEIVSALVARGYPSSDFPQKDGSIEGWLEELVQKVPASVTMDVVKKIVQCIPK